MQVWEKSIKTTYYLRTLAASQISKTVGIKPDTESMACSIDNVDCEVCQ